MDNADVVVVGSGFGGAIPALRLAEAGRSVVVLEQGERLADRDFVQDWSFRAQSRLFVTYTSSDFTVFLRYGRGLGGGSLTYAAAMLRAPSEVFAYQDRHGYRVWPLEVTRAALDPHYERVESTMSVRQATWDEVPRAGGCFAMLLDRMGLTCDRACYPMKDCLQCGFCMCGCMFGRKQHLGKNYIPAAERHGAEFRTRCWVHHLQPAGSGWEVHYLDPWGDERAVRGERVVLAAGALETPALLLRSREWLPDLHPMVGRNLNNNGDVALMFELPDGFPDAYGHMGRNNAGMITYAFWDEHRITIHAGAGPPALFAALDVVRDDGAQPQRPWGLPLKHFLRDNYPHRVISTLAIGLVDGEGQVTVDGRGSLRFELPPTEGLSAYIDRVAGVARRICDATGARLLRTGDDTVEHGDAHPHGTCRKGDDGERAPCAPTGELRGAPGVFCADGSSIPGGTGVNPALTIAANAERISAGLVERS